MLGGQDAGQPDRRVAADGWRNRSGMSVCLTWDLKLAEHDLDLYSGPRCEY